MELGYIPSKNKKRRVPAIRGMHLVCVYVCKREGQIGSARVTPEDEKTTREGENMKGWVRSAERKRKRNLTS